MQTDRNIILFHLDVQNHLYRCVINKLLRIFNQTLCGTLLGQDILTLDKSDVTHGLWGEWPFQWASYQIRKIAGCACAGNAGNVFPRRRFQRKQLVSDPGMHHGTCVTCRDACRDRLPAVTGKTFPAFPAHAHPQFCVSGKRPIVSVGSWIMREA